MQSCISAGFTGASPRSAKFAISNGLIRVAPFIARIIVDKSRIWRGPWRGPERLVVPASQGTPIKPKSTSLIFALSNPKCGNRIKLGIPAKRGNSIPSTG